MADNLPLFLLSSSGISHAASLRDVLFESLAHKLIAACCCGTLRALYGTVTEGGNLPSIGNGAPVLFRSLVDLVRENNRYYQPSISNLASADGFACVNNCVDLFQITVSSDHPVKTHGIQAIRALFPTVLSARLIFVVPADISAAFRLQNYVTLDRGISKVAPTLLTQWVVPVVLSAEFSRNHT